MKIKRATMNDQLNEISVHQVEVETLQGKVDSLQDQYILKRTTTSDRMINLMKLYLFIKLK